MVMTNDTPKKTAKSGSPSRPSALRNGIVSPACPFGGVCGRAKEKRPRASEAPAAIRSGSACASTPIVLTIQPATIQPIVPHTRMPGNCFSGLTIWLNEIALTRASVGL
jgi:hypothetical protein